MIRSPLHAGWLGPTAILIGANVVFYVYTSILGGDFIQTGDSPLYLFAQVNSEVFQGGAYWQLFTSLFVHVDIVHLVGNMFFLLIFGLRAEELFNVRQYFLIYFASGLAGNVLTLFVPFIEASAGASGAIFGVFAAVTIYLRRSVGQSIMTALFYVFFLLLFNIGAQVNVFAHLGGAFAGLIIGYWLARRRKKPSFHMTYSYSR